MKFSSIRVLKDAVGQARLGRSEKLGAIRQLDRFVRRVEAECDPSVHVEAWIEKERAESHRYGGHTGFSTPPARRPVQLSLFP